MRARGEWRNRGWLAFAVLLVVTLGLGSRSGSVPLPAFLVKYAGDALWAVLVFLLVAIAALRRSALFCAAVALALAFAVEGLQLYQAPWLNSIRNTVPGRLVLGQGFLLSDLICYTVGIALAAVLYQVITQRNLRHVPTIIGAGIAIIGLIAVLAYNLGAAPEQFGCESD